VEGGLQKGRRDAKDPIRLGCACGHARRPIARLCAIKADIAAHLGEQELSVNTVAARQGVSPRYVQMLFEAEGTTFSRFVLGQRLASAHRLLSDPRYAACTITAIALEAGFGDLSTFNHAFRRAYGGPPSDVRAAVRCQTGGTSPR
jgi:AraC-like DNA-binding protein